MDDMIGRVQVFDKYIEKRKKKINWICKRYNVKEEARALIVAQLLDILGEAEKIFYVRSTEDCERPVSPQYIHIGTLANAIRKGA